MDSMRLLDQINAVCWASYPQPEWNKPDAVSNALSKVARGDATAYDELLYAVGNNHSGTYYPVLLAVLPFLERLATGAEPIPQRTALCVLDDLLASFYPEPGFEEFHLPEFGTVKVETVFKERMHALRPALQQVASTGAANSPLAQQLLLLLSEDAA